MLVTTIYNGNSAWIPYPSSQIHTSALVPVIGYTTDSNGNPTPYYNPSVSQHPQGSPDQKNEHESSGSGSSQPTSFFSVRSDFSLSCYSTDAPMKPPTSSNKPYRCQICEYKTDRRYDLQRHETVHVNNRPYECPVCGERFNRRDNAQRHCASDPSEEERIPLYYDQ
jgi:hypothetical protein